LKILKQPNRHAKNIINLLKNLRQIVDLRNFGEGGKSYINKSICRFTFVSNSFEDTMIFYFHDCG